MTTASTTQGPLQELTTDLVDELGWSEAHQAISLLRERDGGDCPEAWRRELEAAYFSGGTNRAQEQKADRLRLHLQWQRRKMGKALAKYNTEVSRKAWARLHGPPLAELIEQAELPLSRQKKVAELLRGRLAKKWGVGSTTHLPPTILDEAVNDELLRLRMAYANGGTDQPGRLRAELLKGAEAHDVASAPLKDEAHPQHEAPRLRGAA